MAPAGGETAQFSNARVDPSGQLGDGGRMSPLNNQAPSVHARDGVRSPRSDAAMPRGPVCEVTGLNLVDPDRDAVAHKAWLDKDLPCYMATMVLRRSSKGKELERRMILTYQRLVLLTRDGHVKRYLFVPLVHEMFAHDASRQVLLKVDREPDLVLKFNEQPWYERFIHIMQTLRYIQGTTKMHGRDRYRWNNCKRAPAAADLVKRIQDRHYNMRLPEDVLSERKAKVAELVRKDAANGFNGAVRESRIDLLRAPKPVREMASASPRSCPPEPHELDPDGAGSAPGSARAPDGGSPAAQAQPPLAAAEAAQQHQQAVAPQLQVQPLSIQGAAGVPPAQQGALPAEQQQQQHQHQQQQQQQQHQHSGADAAALGASPPALDPHQQQHAAAAGHGQEPPTAPGPPGWQPHPGAAQQVPPPLLHAAPDQQQYEGFSSQASPDSPVLGTHSQFVSDAVPADAATRRQIAQEQAAQRAAADAQQQQQEAPAGAGRLFDFSGAQGDALPDIGVPGRQDPYATAPAQSNATLPQCAAPPGEPQYAAGPGAQHYADPAAGQPYGSYDPAAAAAAGGQGQVPAADAPYHHAAAVGQYAPADAAGAPYAAADAAVPQYAPAEAGDPHYGYTVHPGDPHQHAHPTQYAGDPHYGHPAQHAGDPQYPPQPAADPHYGHPAQHAGDPRYPPQPAGDPQYPPQPAGDPQHPPQHPVAMPPPPAAAPPQHSPAGAHPHHYAAAAGAAARQPISSAPTGPYGGYPSPQAHAASARARSGSSGRATSELLPTMMKWDPDSNAPPPAPQPTWCYAELLNSDPEARKTRPYTYRKRLIEVKENDLGLWLVISSRRQLADGSGDAILMTYITGTGNQEPDRNSPSSCVRMGLGFYVTTETVRWVFVCPTTLERDLWVRWLNYNYPHTCREPPADAVKARHSRFS